LRTESFKDAALFFLIIALLIFPLLLISAGAAWGQNIEWTKQFGTSSDDYAYGVAIDASGNVYLAGRTWGALPGQTNLGGYDAFVVKYDGHGNEIWTRQFGTSADDFVNGVAIDASGNVYVAGVTYGVLSWQTGLGDYDTFVRKYDGSGSEVWTRQFGTSDGDAAFGVAVDASGGVYVAGYTHGVLPGQTLLGDYDAFVRKYDNSSNEIWAKQFGTSNEDSAAYVAVEASGNVYVAGFTRGVLPGQTRSGFTDAFVRKYDGEGNELWTRQFGTSIDDHAGGVAVDGSGNVYVAGYTYGALPGQENLGDGDAFVRKYDGAGNELWTRQFGTSGDDYAIGVAVNTSGSVYVAGITGATLPGQTSWGGSDAFLVKFGEVPFKEAPTNWPLIAGVVGVIVVIGIVAALYMRRRKPTEFRW